MVIKSFRIIQRRTQIRLVFATRSVNDFVMVASNVHQILLAFRRTARSNLLFTCGGNAGGLQPARLHGFAPGNDIRARIPLISSVRNSKVSK